jgi:hypothetical protein
MKLESKNTGFHIEGFIDITLEREGGTIKQRFYNALSPAYKEAILASLASKLYMGMRYKCGYKKVISGLLASSSGYDYIITPLNINNILLNNSSIVGVPGAISKGFNTDLTINNDVITGYAGKGDTAAGAVGKRIENQNKATRVSADVVAAQWQYPEGVATGTITHIGMMCGSPSENSGMRTIRCLDNFDLSEANFNSTSPSTKFFPPGVPGITGDYEVMFDGNDGTSSSHKINLNTGVVEDNPTGYRVIQDVWTQDYLVIGNYMYVIEQSYLEVYELPNYSNVHSIRLSDYGASNSVNSKRCLFYDYTNDVLYLILGCESSGSVCGAKITSNGTYFSSATAITDYSELGLPFTVDPTKYTVKSLGSTKFCLIPINTSSSNTVFTALVIGMSLVDSKVDIKNVIYPLYKQSIIAWVENTSTFYVLDRIQDNTKYIYYNDSSDFGMSDVFNIAARGPISTLDQYLGVVYSAEEDCTQLLSLSALTTPIQKGANDTLYVTYGYRIV